MLRRRKAVQAEPVLPPGSGTVRVAYAWCAVWVSCSRLTEEQYVRVKYILGETYGSWFVKEVANRRLEVQVNGQTWTPEKLRRNVLEVLRVNMTSIPAYVTLTD